MMRVLINGGIAALCALLLLPHAALAGDVEQVISLRPGVHAERSGQMVPLEQKSPVSSTDILATDATGRAQILFNDDSTVALGSNTRLVLEEVVTEGGNPVFRARMGQGMARFITGKIVEQNPQGFSVVTPEATVGIRGTIFAVNVGDGKTTVFVLNTTRQVYVNDILVPTGYKITLPDGAPLPMTRPDMDLLGSVTASGGAPAEQEEKLTLAGGNAVFDMETLEQPDLGKTALGDSLKATGQAYITGTLHNANLYAAPGRGVGSFTFNVNLGNGAISGATMNGYHPLVGQNPDGGGGLDLAVSYNLSGGSGKITGSSFQVSGFSGNTSYRGMAGSISPGIGSAGMSGTASMTSSGLEVDGQYAIEFPGGGMYDNGTFTGKQQ